MAGFYGGTPGHSNIISLKASALTKSVSSNMAIGEKVIIESSDSQVNGTIWEKINNAATQSAMLPTSDVSSDFFFIGKLKGVKGDKNSVYQIVKNIEITSDGTLTYQGFLQQIANILSGILVDNDLWAAQKTILVQGKIKYGSNYINFDRLVILKEKDTTNGIVTDLGPTEQYQMVSIDSETKNEETLAGRKIFNYKPLS